MFFHNIFEFSGRVLNRFSKDVSSLDDSLPFQMSELLMVSWHVDGEVVC